MVSTNGSLGLLVSIYGNATRIHAEGRVDMTRGGENALSEVKLGVSEEVEAGQDGGWARVEVGLEWRLGMGEGRAGSTTRDKANTARKHLTRQNHRQSHLCSGQPHLHKRPDRVASMETPQPRLKSASAFYE